MPIVIDYTPVIANALSNFGTGAVVGIAQAQREQRLREQAIADQQAKFQEQADLANIHESGNTARTHYNAGAAMDRAKLADTTRQAIATTSDQTRRELSYRSASESMARTRLQQQGAMDREQFKAKNKQLPTASTAYKTAADAVNYGDPESVFSTLGGATPDMTGADATKANVAATQLRGELMRFAASGDDQTGDRLWKLWQAERRKPVATPNEKLLEEAFGAWRSARAAKGLPPPGGKQAPVVQAPQQAPTLDAGQVLFDDLKQRLGRIPTREEFKAAAQQQR